MYKFTLVYPWIFLIVAVKAYLADENETGLGINELAEYPSTYDITVFYIAAISYIISKF